MLAPPLLSALFYTSLLIYVHPESLINAIGTYNQLIVILILAKLS